MVYVNSIKYACESCIKGHRSSSCHHNERPLFEIKKKGRPVSQCEKCRELRQSKRVHGKCNCTTVKSSEGVVGEAAVIEPVTKKVLPGKRFIPITPSLPNGLKDALNQSNTASDILIPRRSVDALLNPCQCKGSACNCNGPRSNSSSSQSMPRCKPIDPSIFNDGLSALALVASCCFPASSSPSTATAGGNKATTQEPSGCCSGAAKPDSTLTSVSSKAAGKRKRSSSPPTMLYNHYVAGVLEPPFHSSQPSRPLPTLPFSQLPLTEPHLSLQHSPPPAAQSKATSAQGCCCGTRCECAGCRLHNALQTRSTKSWVDFESEEAAAPAVSVAGPLAASRPAPTAFSARSQEHSKGCGPDCPTCVDHDGGVELPPIHNYGSGYPHTATLPSSPPPPPSFIAEYFTRTASSSSSSSQIPPTRETFEIDARWREALGGQHQQPRRLFPITQAPASAKFEACCSGACGCGETCGCGYECDGCCLSRSADGPSASAPTAAIQAIHHHQPVEQARTRVSRSPSVSFARHSPAQDQRQQPRESTVMNYVSSRPLEKKQCCCPK